MIVLDNKEPRAYQPVAADVRSKSQERMRRKIEQPQDCGMQQKKN
jgi:hypothetical protein